MGINSSDPKKTNTSERVAVEFVDVGTFGAQENVLVGVKARDSK